MLNKLYFSNKLSCLHLKNLISQNQEQSFFMFGQIYFVCYLISHGANLKILAY